MPGDRQGAVNGPARIAFRVAVTVVALLSLLPIADWIPGDPTTNIPPPIWPMYAIWLIGLVVLGAVAWGLARFLPGGGAKDDARPRQERRRDKRARKKSGDKSGEDESRATPDDGETTPRLLDGPWIPALLLALITLLVYGRMAWAIFDGRPLHVDAMTQALQAHIMAGGHLSVPVADDPRFFSSALLVEFQGRAFSQFPPGWAGLLAIGFRLGIPWLMSPLLGSLAVVATWRMLRDDGESGRFAFFTALLFGLSPWWAFNASTWMSHVPNLAFVLMGSVALIRSGRQSRPGLWGLGAGAALGLATIIRPLEGVSFGLPATVWVLWRGWNAWRTRAADTGAPASGLPPALKGLVGFAVGGTLTIGLLLLYNQIQHGSPTLFGFELQWGPDHRLGFHEAPWGPPHTFLRGLQLMNGYLLGLQLLYFDAPIPSALLAFAALLLVRKLSALDRYLLAGCTLVLLGYLSFWGEGHDLGPRYLIPLAPLVAIWTLRFARLVAADTGKPRMRRWGYAMAGLFLLAGWLVGTPTRWFVYSRSDPLRRLDVGILNTPRANDALVFVPSPWSIQVQARLRSTGMSRQQAEWFYYRVGLCKLDVALSQLEARNVTDPDAVVTALKPLAADSASMVVDRVAGTPGDPFTGLAPADSAAVQFCQLRQQAVQDKGGYMLLPFEALLGPTWTGDGPIVAHDLQEEDRRLLAAYPDREAFWLKAVRVRADGVRQFVLEPMKADSVNQVWDTYERLSREAKVLQP